MARRDITGAVDFGLLEGYAAGDQALIDEVLGLFRQQAEMWIRLAGSARRLRRPGASRAHTLKGASWASAPFDLARACAAAEQGETAGPGEKTVMLDHMRNALEAALADIAAYEHESMLRSLKTPR